MLSKTAYATMMVAASNAANLEQWNTGAGYFSNEAATDSHDQYNSGYIAGGQYGRSNQYGASYGG